ncbi:MAG: hypothetical protein J0M08_00015 [Bacteroidetes bacterium]|nr:hypothetical protein [Bacteroidota bacterium]
MKKIFFCILAVVLCGFASAQCNCGAGSSASGTIDGLNFSIYGSQPLSIELTSDNRFFKETILSNDATTVIDTTNIKLQSTSVSLIALQYRFGRGFGVSTLVPYSRIVSIYKESGIADIPFLVGKSFTFNNRNKFNVSAGVEVPTGKSSLNQNIIVFGSGNFDPLLQVNYQLVKNSFVFIWSSANKLTISNSDKNNFGNYYNQSFFVMYGINKTNTCESIDSLNISKPTFFLSTGLTNEIFGAQTISGKVNYQTGGNMLCAAIGTQLFFSRFGLLLNGFIPVRQNWWSSVQEKTTLRLKASFTITI